MKFVLFVSMLLLFVGLSLQRPDLINCPSDYVLPDYVDSCGRYTCDGDKLTGYGCQEESCEPGKLVGCRATDNTRKYPDCCAGPICLKD